MQNKCINCKYFIATNKDKGLCLKLGKFVLKNAKCKYFKQGKTFEFQKQLNLIPYRYGRSQN